MRCKRKVEEHSEIALAPKQYIKIILERCQDPRSSLNDRQIDETVKELKAMEASKLLDNPKRDEAQEKVHELEQKVINCNL